MPSHLIGCQDTGQSRRLLRRRISRGHYTKRQKTYAFEPDLHYRPDRRTRADCQGASPVPLHPVRPGASCTLFEFSPTQTPEIIPVIVSEQRREKERYLPTVRVLHKNRKILGPDRGAHNMRIPSTFAISSCGILSVSSSKSLVTWG
jgi:hypothetical protein